MADVWAEILGDAKFGDIVFPLHSRSMEGGRDGARIRLPYQDGQRNEDTGRAPRTFKLRIELFSDVDESHYPTLYEEILDLLTEPEGQAEFEYQDPVIGPVRVKCWSWNVDEAADERNGAVITCTLEETTDESALSFLFPPRTPAREVIAAAAELDDALAESDVSASAISDALASTGFALAGDETEWPEGQTFSSLAEDFQVGLAEGQQTVDAVASRIDTARARVRAITSLVEARDAAGWPAFAAAYRLVDALSAMGDAALASAVPIIQITVAGEESAVEIAARLYGDASRADEIIARNPNPRPYAYRAGTVLRVAQR